MYFILQPSHTKSTMSCRENLRPQWRAAGPFDGAKCARSGREGAEVLGFQFQASFRIKDFGLRGKGFRVDSCQRFKGERFERSRCREKSPG